MDPQIITAIAVGRVSDYRDHAARVRDIRAARSAARAVRNSSPERALPPRLAKLFTPRAS